MKRLCLNKEKVCTNQISNMDFSQELLKLNKKATQLKMGRRYQQTPQQIICIDSN